MPETVHYLFYEALLFCGGVSLHPHARPGSTEGQWRNSRPCDGTCACKLRKEKPCPVPLKTARRAATMAQEPLKKKIRNIKQVGPATGRSITGRPYSCLPRVVSAMRRGVWKCNMQGLSKGGALSLVLFIETLATENKRGVLMRHACARTLGPRSFFGAGAKPAAHTQPVLRTGLMASAWRLVHVSRRVILD